MSEIISASRRITDTVKAWFGVTTGIGSRGELSFKVGKREIGHLHGDSVAHFFFNRSLWAELKKAGRITNHPVFPERDGPAARRIRTDEDVSDVIALMRLNYDIAMDRLDGAAIREAMSEELRRVGVADQQHLAGLVVRTEFWAGTAPLRQL